MLEESAISVRGHDSRLLRFNDFPGAGDQGPRTKSLRACMRWYTWTRSGRAVRRKRTTSESGALFLWLILLPAWGGVTQASCSEAEEKIMHWCSAHRYSLSSGSLATSF